MDTSLTTVESLRTRILDAWHAGGAFRNARPDDAGALTALVREGFLACRDAGRWIPGETAPYQWRREFGVV